METPDKYQSVLALDVGERRIGVARAYLDVPFAQPFCTLADPASFIADIGHLCRSEKAAAVVIGLPRGLSGQDTAQTAYVQAFGSELENRLDIPVYWTDEALTSAKAEEELRGRGRPFAKGEVDALAATYILEDFITNHKGQMTELHHG
jgi:putative Holliday junction resolvase